MVYKSIFTKTFGEYPLIKILDFLIYSRDFDYSITEIAQNSKINFQTLKKIWPKLEKDGIVISTRKLGGIKLYKINITNQTVKKLIELNNFLSWEYAEKNKKTRIRA